MYKRGDIVKFISLVGIIDQVYINADDETDVIYAVAWAKNAYQTKPTELVSPKEGLTLATSEELEQRINQLVDKYADQVDQLRKRSKAQLAA